jgi:peptide-methionine (S)-S-oxide reductase
MSEMQKPNVVRFAMVALLLVSGCVKTAPQSAAAGEKSLADQTQQSTNSQSPSAQEDQPMPNIETVTLGAGCFWCVESVLLRIKGVESVVSGYMGGTVANPTYQAVCTGLTGHAEVVQVKFDRDVISFDELLDVFWQLHDPTTLNRQGPDVGTQYRSAIFYHTDEQRQTAEASKQKWDKSRKIKGSIVTEITPAGVFYPAEDYHQDFFNKNPGNAYCRVNILPKFKKLGLLKPSDR